MTRFRVKVIIVTDTDDVALTCQNRKHFDDNEALLVRFGDYNMVNVTQVTSQADSTMVR